MLLVWGFPEGPVEQAKKIRLPTPTTTLCSGSMSGGFSPHLGLYLWIKLHPGHAMSVPAAAQACGSQQLSAVQPK